jgi:hypothetical protein
MMQYQITNPHVESLFEAGAVGGAAGGRAISKFCISLASSALLSFKKLSRFVSLANAVGGPPPGS